MKLRCKDVVCACSCSFENSAASTMAGMCERSPGTAHGTLSALLSQPVKLLFLQTNRRCKQVLAINPSD